MKSTSLAQQGLQVDARQFYQHDPLFILLKERWQFRNGWILLGLPGLAV